MRDIEQTAELVIKLWKPIRGNAYRIVNCITNDDFMTEDVLQDALIAAAEKFHTLEDIEKFDKWFYTIAKRRAYNALKRKKRVVPVEEVYYSEEIENNCNQNLDKTLLLIEDNDEFIDMLRHLSKKERHLITLRFVNGMKIDEISEHTGIKSGTIKSIYSRAYKKLREIYSKENSYEKK